MSVPGRLLPLYVLLGGRRPCCGVRRADQHLDGCVRHPWSRRADGHLRAPSDGTPQAAAYRIETACERAAPSSDPTTQNVRVHSGAGRA
jgi:hypothetical protein